MVPVTPVTRGTIATANLPGLLATRISSLRKNLSGYKIAPYLPVVSRMIAASHEASLWAYRRAETKRAAYAEVTKVQGDAGSTSSYLLEQYSAETPFDKTRDPAVINGQGVAARDLKIVHAAAVVLNDIERLIAQAFWTPGNWQYTTAMANGVQNNAVDFFKIANARLDAMLRRGVTRDMVTMFCHPDALSWIGNNTLFGGYFPSIQGKAVAPSVVAQFIAERLGIKAVQTVSNNITTEVRDVASPTLTETWSNDRILFTVVGEPGMLATEPQCGRVLYYPQTEGGLAIPDVPDEASIVTVVTTREDAKFEVFDATAEMVVMKHPSANWLSEMLTNVAGS